jgi:glycosyltransferase involved in cell wall biosynthesis
MNIGVDGGSISTSDKRLQVGVYKVTIRLLEALSCLDTHNNYRIYSFNRLGEGIKKIFSPRMKEVYVTPTFMWQSAWLPLELAKRPVDVFLGISQTIPANTSYNIGFVYDLAYLHFPQAYPKSLQKLTWLTKALLERSNAVIAISETVKKDLITTYSYPKHRIFVCHLGVDPIFTLRGKKHIEKHPYFLFVGALKPIKNVPAVIRAFDAFMKTSKKPYELILVGGDKWMDEKITDAIYSSPNVQFIKRAGVVDDTTLAEYYRGATALLNPSLYEGFCLPVIEAMASGTPVIASNTGSLPEVAAMQGY